MRKLLISLLVLSISCQTITQFSTQEQIEPDVPSEITTPTETPEVPDQPTETIVLLDENPWLLALTDCFDPKFTYNFDQADKDTIFRYFQGMWREAEIVLNPEPQNLDELYDIALSSDLPLSSIHLSIDPSCVWITLPSEQDGNYYLLYRTKDSTLSKLLLKNDAILKMLAGQWFAENSDTVIIDNQTLSIKAECTGTSTISLPLFTANSSVACFGSEEGYICTEYLGPRMMQMSANGSELSGCVTKYFSR